MYPYLSLGPLLIQLPILALLLGVWISSFLAEREAARLKLPTTAISNLIVIGLAAGIAGARLAYAARYPEAYLANPLGLFALNVNTLAGFEGLLVGLLFAFLYGQRKGLPLRPTLDALAPGLAAFLVALGLAHFLSGDAFGVPTDLPWSIYLWGEARHPSQVYEILLALVVFLIALKKPFGQGGSGVNFWLVVALTAAGRIFLEAFRGDSLVWPGGFRAAQIISLVILAASLVVMRLWADPKTAEEDS